MKKNLILFLSLVFVLSSCGSSLKLTGNYPQTNSYYAETSQSYDKVWDKIIDYFAVAGIPISNIDKSSGLIVSSKVSFLNTYTREVDGKPLDPTAYVVIPTVRGGFGNVLEPRAFITGDWSMNGDFNVRVKNADDGKVIINVNLVNLSCTYRAGYSGTSQIPIKSTGRFEHSLIEMFK